MATVRLRVWWARFYHSNNINDADDQIKGGISDIEEVYINGTSCKTGSKRERERERECVCVRAWKIRGRMPRRPHLYLPAMSEYVSAKGWAQETMRKVLILLLYLIWGEMISWQKASLGNDEVPMRLIYPYHHTPVRGMKKIEECSPTTSVV